MRRLDDLRKRLERATLGKERDIAKRYANLYRELHQLTGIYFERYERGGKLEFQEMIRFNRLEKMLQEMNEIINGSETGLRNEIHGLLKDHYKEAYYQTAFILETGAMAKIGYTTVKNEVLDAAVNNKFTGLTLNERLSKRRGDLIYSMRETITRGLVEGQTYRSMANIIKNELEGDLVKAHRIVRTETHRIRESAGLESVLYAESKGIIMKKTWNTVKDERVRSSHNNLDGTKVDANEKFIVNGHEADHPTDPNLPPEESINCRCFLTFEIEKVERPQHEEMADLTYAEWKKERLR